ncbi:hypothetical protein THIOM_000190 [Candidatus Thiomargarita nelsonii]|uniref:Lcl C-terminal domain-containing protein n=1 Tax=Candidatus Thiomargarita nelsonii TaxID=1003181 RepID=A0A176S7B1_9GAMM|nr:hypothetical protein THIOM_000190 [Candidatus Thiomargarita nelsonii]
MALSETHPTYLSGIIFDITHPTMPHEIRDYRVCCLSNSPRGWRNDIFRYIDNGDGTVTDNKTGLIWLKNANCFGEQDWKTAMLRAAKLAHGQCSLNDRSKPGDWRLPTEDEWEAMVDERYILRTISNGTGQWKQGDAFTGVQSSWYWSSTASSTSSAWLVRLSDGRVGNGGKTLAIYVWAVRDGH